MRKPVHAIPDADLEAWNAELTAPDMDADRLRRYLQDGIDALPSGFALFDADERCVVMNRRFVAMLPTGAAMLAEGARFPEMARHNAENFFGIDAEKVDEWLAARIAFRENPQNGAFDQELADGRWYRIEESRTFDGGTVTNWTDITDLKAQQRVATDAADALQRSNSALTDFAHAASHDLKEPLRKIEVYGSRLAARCGDNLDDKSVRYLERMTDATRRMRVLIGDLLDYARLGHEAATHGPVALDSVLADVRKILDLVIRETDARIAIPALPTVTGNAGQLARLFQNLLSNALKYVGEGVTPRIVLTVEATDAKTVTLCITDNGIGMEPSQTEEIFAAFTRLNGRTQYEGTGVGLASCRKIAEQHGGRVWAESEPGAGSRFYVTLPLV